MKETTVANINAVIKNRYEVTALVQAVMCNPNGDPDKNNTPRRDPISGFGIITDGAIKSWIRNYILNAYGSDPGMEILMQNGTSINKKVAESVLKVNGFERKAPKGFESGKNLKVTEATQDMCARFWDVRTFGGVLTTGLNAGQVKGPVQVAMATSVDPIDPRTITITRKAYAEGKFLSLDEYEKEESERPDDKKRTMGDKSYIPYGLYVIKITISVALAEKFGFTEDDLSKLFEALVQMLDANASSSKMGMGLASPIIIFKHVGTQPESNAAQNEKEARLGCAPADKLFGLLDVHKKDGVEKPLSINDYEIVFNRSKLPRGIEIGLKTMPFEDIQWGEKALDEWDGVKII